MRYNSHMLPLISEHREAIESLCKKHRVKRLEVFGSAASGEFDPSSSDIDFFYEFDSNDMDHLADRFFGLQEDLENLLGVKVDLISAKDAVNPFFLQVANRHRVSLYAA
jgi:predicted nucleotidyltransferase